MSEKVLQSFMDKLPAKSPRTILTKLNEYCSARSHAEDFYRPVVTLMVQGSFVTGQFYKLGADDNRDFVLLFNEEDFSVISIELQLVASVSVKHADKFAHILSFGNIQRPLDEAAVGGLALSKKLKEIAEGLNSNLGSSLQFDVQNAGDESINANVKDLAQTLDAVIRKLCFDNFGKESLAKVSKIIFVHVKNGDLAMKKQGADILIEADFSIAPSLTAAVMLESNLNQVL